MQKCKYAAIKDFDINQSDGISVSLWMQGCEHRCEGCHNVDTWDFNKGYDFTDDTINKIKYLLKKDGIHKNLSVLGGESLSSNKIDMLYKLFEQVKEMDDSIEIWVWTGYLFEDVKDMPLIEYIDFLIDGKYDKSLHITNRYFGSSNQRIIDIKESLKQNKIIIKKE